MDIPRSAAASVPESVADECRFLHDLAGPLTTAVLTFELFRETRKNLTADQAEHLARLEGLIGRIEALIRERRKVLQEQLQSGT